MKKKTPWARQKVEDWFISERITADNADNTDKKIHP